MKKVLFLLTFFRHCFSSSQEYFYHFQPFGRNRVTGQRAKIASCNETWSAVKTGGVNYFCRLRTDYKHTRTYPIGFKVYEWNNLVRHTDCGPNRSARLHRSVSRVKAAISDQSRRLSSSYMRSTKEMNDEWSWGEGTYVLTSLIMIDDISQNMCCTTCAVNFKLAADFQPKVVQIGWMLHSITCWWDINCRSRVGLWEKTILGLDWK